MIVKGYPRVLKVVVVDFILMSFGTINVFYYNPLIFLNFYDCERLLRVV